MSVKFVDNTMYNSVKFFGRNIAFDSEEDNDPLVIEQLSKILNCDDDASLYVLTTESGINGSLAWFYPETRQKLLDMGFTDFYVLPSSIHELLILPSNSKKSEDDLIDTVRSINETVVEQKDILGYSILHCHDGITEVIGNES